MITVHARLEPAFDGGLLMKVPSQNPAASNGGDLSRLPKPQYKFLLECLRSMIEG
jgi:hypothetical protein